MRPKIFFSRQFRDRTVLSLIFLFMTIGGPFLSAGQAVKESDLPPKYRDWLKLVSYIVLPQEREVFFQLSNDRDRDIFIESFWKQRDPTPGTPQNEFRDEHIKRFQYANAHYGRGTPREGWQTDMGRIYIILGPPASDERFEGKAGIHPCHVWYYYGDQTKGLPTYFALVFFQRGGSGEFKLYNPTSDGPLSLLVNPHGIDITDYRAQYEKIKELAPTLANVAISLIPGQYPYNYQPSPQSNILLAEILESPKKSISPSYATHFLNYRGIVSTEYLTNYIESEGLAVVLREPLLGISFCHLVMAPKKISVDYFAPKDQYYCNFKLDVSLRRGDEIIYQYPKDFPFYFEPDRLTYIEANGVALEDVFPVIEGRYELTVLLQNSVGKEFSVFEKTIDVPGSGGPQILGPLLGYRYQTSPTDAQAPFKIMDQQFEVDPANTFTRKDRPAIFFNLSGLTEELWRNGTVEISISGLRGTEPAAKAFSVRPADVPFSRVIGMSRGIPVEELPPDYYELRLALVDRAGRTLAEAGSSFIVSPVEEISRPVILFKTFPLSQAFFYYHALAEQHERAGAIESARANYEKALALNPNDRRGAAALASLLVRTKKPDRALEIVEKLKGDDSLRFEYFLIRGLALEEKGECGAAIESLLEGNRIYNSDIRLLNSLGRCYDRIGRKKDALAALQGSLRLNPDQKDIRELVARVERELK